MANPFSKGWKYLTASLDNTIEEKVDPEIQVKQALEAAQKQHAEITRAAAEILGNRNQLEMKLDRLAKDADRLAADARTALHAAEKATAAGDHAKATELNQTAEIIATQLVTVEKEIEDVKHAHAAAQQAAEQAEAQKKQSEMRLEQQTAEANQLRAQINQAKMQEHTVASEQRMRGITADDSVPTLDGVRDKIERRYAQALGAQELVEGSVAGRMAEIESAGRDFAAASRLEQIRAEMNAGTSNASIGSASDMNKENEK